MKKIMTVTEVESEGLLSLLGERVILFCMNYFYAGKLTGVGGDCVLLEDAGIVYETGAFSDAKWKDFQKIGAVHVRIAYDLRALKRELADFNIQTRTWKKPT